MALWHHHHQSQPYTRVINNRLDNNQQQPNLRLNNTTFIHQSPRTTIFPHQCVPNAAHSNHGAHINLHNGTTGFELFVGNLSYFCEENHLYELFNQFVHVLNVRIMRNHDRTKPLMFGFVAVQNEREVQELINLLNGHLFMGRHLIVEGSERGNNNNSYSSLLNNSQSLSRIMTSGNSHSHHSRTHGGQMSAPQQLHVYFSSQFMAGQQITLPTEMFLRKHFHRFGPIQDVVVKEYINNPIEHKQTGYAFITFMNPPTSILEAMDQSPLLIEGVTLYSSVSHGNPTAQTSTSNGSSGFHLHHFPGPIR